MRVVIITYLPSPYQIELFNALASTGELKLSVIYLHRTSSTPIARHWRISGLKHDFIDLTEGPLAQARATDRIQHADFVVFNYYQHAEIRHWMKSCDRFGVRWCFWGERLGSTKLAILGRVYRRLKLARLRHSRAAIWGIGQWAIEQYHAEFGEDRCYFNIPYFSDLSRFNDIARAHQFHSHQRRFLFSGALIERKGVDLLANAFFVLAREFPNVTLTLMGTGDLEEQLCKQLKPLADRVRFLGFQSWQELPRHYAAADILCVPSRYDGWGLVVPEALASGLPVIGTDRTGAAREFIRNGENGFLIASGQQTALVDAMRRAAAWGSAELRSISDAARATVREHSLENGVKRVLAAVRHSAVFVN